MRISDWSSDVCSSDLGVLVGGVGIMADGVYGFDPEIQDVDKDPEEIIALAATTGFAAPEAIRANRITVDGTTLRFAEATPDDFASDPATAPGFATIDRQAGVRSEEHTSELQSIMRISY